VAINTYTGLQGSGKSYEVVSSVIVPAIAAGRRVVTNIDGVSQAEIYKYLLAKNKDVDAEAFGAVVHVTNERILEAAFFYDQAKPDVESVVIPGDIVAVDEAWRFWPADGGKLSDEHMQFFRMHRHYTHPVTGLACDVALMIQDMTSLHRSVKNVVETSYRTTKHKMLGSTKHYRIEVFEGHRQTRSSAISRLQNKYNPKIFPLYQSYAGSNGVEVSIDPRVNIFKRWWLLPSIVVLAGAFVWGTLFLIRFFNPGSKTPLKTSVGVTSSQGAATLVTPDKAFSELSFSAQWRIVGTTTFGSRQFVVVAGPTGRLRYEHPSNFMDSGSTMVGKIDGENVSTFSGVLPGSSNGPPPGGVAR